MSGGINYRVKTAAFALLCVAVYFLLQPLVPEAKAFMLAMSLGVLYIVASERWQFRKQIWFWGVIGLLGIAQISIILSLNASHLAGPSLLIWPMMLVDCWLGYFIIDRINASQKK